MPFHSLALSAYYYGTYPYRTLHEARLRWAQKVPVSVLFYHRVADSVQNGWTIGNAAFQRQMLWLKSRFELISLSEVQQRVESGQNDRPAVAITFDDGYAENCEQAIPFLLEEGIPVTYFVSTDFITKQCPFPHDVAAGAPLAPNTVEQIQVMSRDGIDIGAHTRTHRDVGKISDPETMFDETIVAKRELEALTGSPIRFFAFPFGQVDNLSRAATTLLRDEGVQGVCSAFGGYNHVGGNDPFHIRRFHGDPELARLKNWLTLDPRKWSAGRHFEIPESQLTHEAMVQWRERLPAPEVTIGPSTLATSVPLATQ